MSPSVPIVLVWPMRHHLLRLWCIFFVGRSKVVVVIVDVEEGLVVAMLLVDWPLLLLEVRLCVVGCSCSWAEVFGDAVMFHLVGACCSFDFVLLLWLEKWVA